MPSRYKIRSFFHGPIVKSTKLDAFIAHDVWIRRAAGLVFGDHIVDHFSLVFIFKVKGDERNIDSGSHAHRIEPVFSPITIHPIRLPDLDENASDIVSGLFQKRGRNRAIHAARHANKDAPFVLFNFSCLTFHIAYDIKVSRKQQQKSTKDFLWKLKKLKLKKQRFSWLTIGMIDAAKLCVCSRTTTLK